MSNFGDLVFWGVSAIGLFQLVRIPTVYRSHLALAISVLFIVSITSVTTFLALLAWVAFSYWLGTRSGKGSNFFIYLYFIGVLAVFIGFKTSLIGSFKTNALYDVAVPIGFSFVMFHSIAFILDRKKQELGESPGFFDYLSSSLFFPTISAGPFQKYQSFRDGLKANATSKEFIFGYCLIGLSLYKFAMSGLILSPKLLRSVPLVSKDKFYAGNQLLLGSIFLYLNFSGFSDFVVGVGKMIGFNIPLNFRFPYFSVSMADYWRKWHITLGAWFREYVFFPLSGHLTQRFSWFARHPKWALNIALFTTFLGIGMWHQISLKLLIYALANAILVSFLSFHSRSKTKFVLIALTFLQAIFVNGIFISKDIFHYAEIVKRTFLPPENVELWVTFKVLIFTLFVYVFTYLSERLVDKLGEEEGETRGIVVLNLVLNILLLSFTFLTGLNRADVIYIGY